MLNLLIKDVLKSPGKVLALCLIVYLAATSFFVSLFLAGLGVRWLHKKAKALEAAEREAAREADKAREQAQPEAQKGAAAVAQAAPSPVVQMAPARQYAKSAVVIPLKKTGTD
ncbi:hypothetical protein [Paraburkholderia sp. J8-2]|uniref:hypothetical protein n=1 Tax=Paraburkholderia sp. J8-2 TaxID=2805440 RepID=UPI002AB6CABD|nr:hypothetical protein [Paraburkholderia sp. J8-2]